MENIEIWTLDGSKATPLEFIVEMESEKKFEKILASNPDMLLSGLTLVGRQNWTDSGPLDLLGVDRYGKLCVFELKRNAPSRDAVAQVIDYASDLDAMGWADLCSHISENSGWGGIQEIEDFDAWYNENYGDLESLKPLRLFLVGLGVDYQTERMVNFLANNGVDISLLTFHGFIHAGKTLLAKQVEEEEEDGIASESRRTARNPSQAERWANLHQSADDYGVRELFDSVINMFRETWSEDWRGESPLQNSLRIDLWESGMQVGERPNVYVSVGEEDDVWINFHQRAFTLCEDAFEPAVESMADLLELSPDNHKDWRTATGIQFSLTSADWERHKETITALAQAVYDAWMENGDEEEDETDSEE